MPRRTADDRSREVTLLGLRSDPARWLRPGPLSPELSRRIGRKARSAAAAKRKGAVHAAAGMYITGVFGLMFCYRQVPEEYTQLARFIVAGGVAALTALLIYRTTKDESLTRFIVGAFLDERRCPTCGHDLTGLHPAEDGCTVCPECGGAWRIATPTPSTQGR